jgi:predicted enzyme related to lactoylglutathione lyase
VQLYINIDVDDLDKAIVFYTQGLGLQLSRRLFGGQVAELSGAPVPIQLLAKAAGSATSAQGKGRRDYGRHWTPVHLDFCVEELEPAVARALAAGAIQEGPVREFDWGKIATFSDPFGHGLCLMQMAPGGYDSAADN